MKKLNDLFKISDDDPTLPFAVGSLVETPSGTRVYASQFYSRDGDIHCCLTAFGKELGSVIASCLSVVADAGEKPKAAWHIVDDEHHHKGDCVLCGYHDGEYVNCVNCGDNACHWCCNQDGICKRCRRKAS